MKSLGIIFSFMLIGLQQATGHLSCPEVTSSCWTIKSWLCDTLDWARSMKDWKERIEAQCSQEDLGTEWSELFSCQNQSATECTNQSAHHCEYDSLNCLVCYCQDGKYKNRYRFSQMSKRQREQHRALLKMYDERLRYCTASENCDESTTSVSTPIANSTTVIHEVTTASLYAETEEYAGSGMMTQTQAEVTQVTYPVMETGKPGEPTGSGFGSGSCITTFNGTCYWSHVQSGKNVDFTRAEEICSNEGSVPAYYFPNEEVFNSVAQDLGLKIPSGMTRVDVWTGITIDADTRRVNPPSEESYMRWYPGRPLDGYSYKTKAITHVVFLVSDNNNGLVGSGVVYDSFQTKLLLGVVCQTAML